ncbi:hypothetical protein O9992_20895 [Vibrio lentus]|nr:hypothetical protein [Vibrio lentus]
MCFRSSTRAACAIGKIFSRTINHFRLQNHCRYITAETIPNCYKLQVLDANDDLASQIKALGLPAKRPLVSMRLVAHPNRSYSHPWKYHCSALSTMGRCRWIFTSHASLSTRKAKTSISALSSTLLGRS